jgi:hypothetical protein
VLQIRQGRKISVCVANGVHRCTALVDCPPLGRLRSVGSHHRLSGLLSSPEECTSRKEASTTSASAKQAGSMSKWLLGLAALATVAILHIFSHVSARQAADSSDTVIATFDNDANSEPSGLAHATAQPTWATLGRIGHELLIQKEHACASEVSVST